MRGIEKLRIEANDACKRRGHKMKWEPAFKHEWSRSWLQDAKCVKCGREVQVNDHPAPNDIDIGGEAVALGCED